MNTPVTKQDILDVIKDVPAEDFLAYYYTNCENKCCAIGHYNRLTSADPTDYSSENCYGFKSIPPNLGHDIEHANNANPKNIKETVIAFLSEKDKSSIN